MELSRRRVLWGLGATGVAAGAGLLLTRDGPPTPSRAGGEWTSFGTVALLGWSRRSLAASHDHAAGGHVHGGAATVLVPSAVHGAWTDAVSVDLQVHNGTKEPVELSPGQFRVRVAGGDVTVSLYGADRPAGPIAAGSTATFRIDYLVPPAGGLSLEFADAISMRTHQLGRLGQGSTT
jgi:hypothetical protein